MKQQLGKTNRRFVLISIMLSMFMAAIEGTIVATAMPSIIADLGGFSSFSWVFSAFLLTQAVTIPIYGKLADLYGRKPVFTLGVIIFLTSSILCGFAQSMAMLIAFRLLQGIGAGAVQPIATTIVGDIFTLEERAKVQGFISSVWGISSIIGPALGAIFVQYIHWAWVFWVNIPLGIIAVFGINLFLHENVEKHNHRIDYLGSALIFISISALMLVLIQGGTAWPWTSSYVFSFLGIFIVGMFLFIFQETRAEEPIMPLKLWNNRLVAISNIATLTTGVVMIGVTTFIPTFVQGVLGESPMIAGFALAFMSMGWPLAATFSGRIMIRYGFRTTALIGGIWLILGSLFLLVLQPEKGWLWAAAGSFMIGVGMGLSRTVFIISVQNSVDWRNRGAATAGNMFMGILGNTIGAGMLAGVLNAHLQTFLNQNKSEGTSVTLNIVNELLDPHKITAIPEQILSIVKAGLTLSLHSVYWVVFALALISFVFVLWLPRRISSSKSEG